ncbi:MAG: DUF6516 family protein [Deltaproteobacteria bacterium]|nr:DUF6516 family protein [Deltaproteobacteria bacterium]
MNERVRRHFDEIEARLIECPAILAYQIIRKDISPDDGKLRIRSTLTGGGVFECFLYVRGMGYLCPPLKYSFHWQNAQGKTVRRWDNAPHHKDLAYAPHHAHIGDDHVEGFSGNPDIFAFIDEVESALVNP